MFPESHTHASSGFPGSSWGGCGPPGPGVGPASPPPAARLTVSWELGQPLSDKKRLLEAEAGPRTQDCSPGAQPHFGAPIHANPNSGRGSALLFPLSGQLVQRLGKPLQALFGLDGCSPPRFDSTTASFRKPPVIHPVLRPFPALDLAAVTLKLV